MEQGNSNKIDAIIEEIVKNNSIFKLKSPVEQEKEKVSMAKSINSALSVLNEDGKELVLQELSVDPDEKFKGFIDNVGNIDISGITKYTATIVKAKIEEAEREGIDLRKGSIQSKNVINPLSKEGILTIAALDMMVNEFNNLSREERKEVVNNWSRLTKEQQAEIMGNYANRVQDAGKRLKDKSDREFAENLSKLLKRNSDELKSEPKESGAEEQNAKRSQQYIEYIQNAYPLLYKEFLQYLTERDESISGKSVLEIVDKFETFKNQKIAFLAEKFDEEVEKFESGEQLKVSQELREELRQLSEIDGGYIAIMEGKTIESLKDGKQVDVDEENLNVEQNGINIITEITNNSQERTLTPKEKLSKAIQKNFEELFKKGFSQEDITNGLKMYMEMIQSIPIDIYEDIGNSDAIIEFFKSGIEPSQNKSDEVLEIFSQSKFGGDLYEMLTDSQMRDEVFLPILNMEVEKLTQTQRIDFSLEKGAQEFKEMQPLPEEVVAELQAIPVALQRINCQPEDIAKGMETYKQIIEGLSSEEIDGVQGNITEILQKEVEELGLDGVAGDILKMMSQITFNGQLSEILKNSKDAFITSLNGLLLDPRVYAGNPEQNNFNSSNSSSLTEIVDEDTLKAGFEALAVDLQIADPTIIRPEELVTDENAQLENGQEENTELPKKEARKEKAEGAVISKLQAFFGVYRNAGMIEVQEVSEEIKEIVQELDLNLQNNNVHRVEEEIKNDEGIEQG